MSLTCVLKIFAQLLFKPVRISMYGIAFGIFLLSQDKHIFVLTTPCPTPLAYPCTDEKRDIYKIYC